MNKIIKREKYLQRIRPFYENELIKVLIGIRRSGKTQLLKIIHEEIEGKNIPKSNFIYLNMEDIANIKLRDYLEFHKYILEYFKGTSGKVYIFIDEIQFINKFEDAINSLRVNIDCSMFITGSNANLLSGELATLLSGRYIQFNIFPFDFKEYIEYTGYNHRIPKTFEDYMLYGGFPQIAKIDDQAQKREVLDSLLNTIILKDILARSKDNKDAELLDGLIRYIMSHTGCTFSLKAITNYIKQNIKPTSEVRIKEYIDLILNSMIASKCRRYDIAGKKVIDREEKYYAVEHGLSNEIIDYTKVNKGHILETIIYNHFVSRGYKVHVGKTYNSEVDFVVSKHDVRKYIQVALTMDSPETEEREFGALLKIKDHYEKIVLSLYGMSSPRDGIKHINIIDFLLDENK